MELKESLKQIKDFFSHELDEKYCTRYKIQHFDCGVEKDHGRIEKRDYYLCTNLKWLAEKDEWAELHGIGMVKCHRNTKNGESTDFSDIIKKPKIPLSHKRTLCIKRENCLLRVLQNL